MEMIGVKSDKPERVREMPQNMNTISADTMQAIMKTTANLTSIISILFGESLEMPAEMKPGCLEEGMRCNEALACNVENMTEMILARLTN